MTNHKSHPNDAGHHASAELNLDLRKLWHALLHNGWVVALCLLVTLGLALAYLRYTPVLYTATATIQVEQQEQQIVKMEGNQREDLRSLDIVQTIAQSLKRRSVLQRVAESNLAHLDPAQAGASSKAASSPQLLNELDAIIDVKLRRGTRLIDVSVQHRSPNAAAHLANSVINENIRDMAAQHTSSSEVAGEFLVAEAERLKKRLQDSEVALQTYRERSGASSLDERQNTVVDRLKELSSKVTEAKAARIKAETEYAQVANFGTNVESLLTLSVVANNPSVISAQNSLNRGENDFAAIRQRYKEKHPKYIQVGSQVLELRANLDAEVIKSAQTMKAAVESARAAGEAVEKTLADQEAAALELSKLAIQYGVLNREVQSDRALYESVLNRLKESTITKEVQPNRIRVVQTAFLPDRPSSPKKALILALAAIAGIAIGVLMVFAFTTFDSSVRTVDEVEAMLNFPVLAAVPHMKEVRRGSEIVVVAEDAQSAGAEAFRSLRAALSMLGRIEDRRTFLMTSAVPEEGKTFCSINFAASLAQLGLKTLLIDADLRRPAVELNLTGKRTQTPGVTDFLVGRKRLEEVAQPTNVTNLEFVSGGTMAPNPAELLANTGLKPILEEALKTYDRVVVDSAPIHAVSDTLLLVKNVQTVCLVVRAARTPRRAITRCMQALLGAEAPVSGVVLNRVPRRRSLGYGYYYDPYYDYSYQGKYSGTGVYGAK